MSSAPSPSQHTPRHDLCHRCLQPLPPRVKRCPACSNPVHSNHRALPLIIGFVGLGALVFIMLVMWIMARNEDLAKGPSLVDEGAQTQEQVLHDASSTESAPKASNQPSKPEKPPPLNER